MWGRCSLIAFCVTGTSFKRLIPDDSVVAREVDKLVFCNGKIYYDLAKV
jgi:2-oxoglutarate dehydrogenase complex dehydrogenase (E1) component-like enzyme